MAEPKKVVVAGLGEVGGPLFEIASRHHETIGVDIEPVVKKFQGIDVMHICFPFQIKDFVGEVTRRIEHFKPALTIINSTVAVGTTRAVAERSGAVVVNSPVRGKHVRMVEDLFHYTKFVGALDPAGGERAAGHFQSSPEATELAKLTETTYFGLMIAWAQEVERYCDHLGLNYDEVVSIYEEITFFPPVKYFPGIIGGHCVMPNIEILSRLGHSEFLHAIKWSNRNKKARKASRIRDKLATRDRLGAQAARLTTL
jgi:UDP-N-acetyl-D-mannosaminuronate dehydrogenase